MIRGVKAMAELRRRRAMGVSEKGFEAEEPVAEEVRPGVVWDPVLGVRGGRGDLGVLPMARVEALVVEEIERRLAEPEAPAFWRNPLEAGVGDQRDRLVMVASGAKFVARLNHWRKWVAVGVGVIDPVAYAEIPEVPADFPWYEGMR